VTSLKPFFSSETTKSEFQTQFNKKMISKLLASFNTALSKGIKLPFGTRVMPLFKNTKVEIQEDYIIIEA